MGHFKFSSAYYPCDTLFLNDVFDLRKRLHSQVVGDLIVIVFSRNSYKTFLLSNIIFLADITEQDFGFWKGEEKLRKVLRQYFMLNVI